MSIEAAREYLAKFGMDGRIKEFDVSSATVELAARALGTQGQRIAKSMSFKSGDGAILVLAAGDVKIDNRKFKETFSFKAKMTPPAELAELVGHEMGGVCPFGIKDGVKVYLDESLKRFETVFPAAGSSNSAIEMTVEELEKYAQNFTGWVDVCKLA